MSIREDELLRYLAEQDQQPTEDDVRAYLGGGDQPGKLASFGRGVAQGATLGFADEGTAGLKAIGAAIVPGGRGFRDTFSEEVEESRAEDQAAREAHPWAMGMGEVLGSVAPAMAGGAAALAGRGAARIGARAVASGAGMGALDAAGRAEGSLTERLPEAAVGGAAGALVSNVAAPALGWAGRKVAGGLGIHLRRPATRAADELIDALEGNPRQLLDNATGTPGETAMELSPAVRDLADTSNLYPHARRGAMRDFIEGRAKGQYGQAREALETATGFRRQGAATMTEQLRRQRSETAREMFPAAYARGQVQLTPKLQELLQRPALQRAYQRGQEIAAESGDQLVGEMGFADDAARSFVLPDVRTLHYIKMGVDDDLGRLQNTEGIRSHLASRIGDTRRELMNEIRNLRDVNGQPIPELMEALETYAGDSGMLNAIQLGRTFHSDPTDEIRLLLEGMTDGEREMYRRSALDNMVHHLGQIADPNNRIRTFLDAPNWQERLELLASGPEELASATQRLRGLAEQGATRGTVLRNSATEGRATRREAYEGSGMGTRLSPRTILDEVASGSRSRAATEKAEAMTPLLMEQDLPSLVQILEDRVGERAAGARRAATGRRLAGMLSGGGLSALLLGNEEEGR